MKPERRWPNHNRRRRSAALWAALIFLLQVQCAGPRAPLSDAGALDLTLRLRPEKAMRRRSGDEGPVRTESSVRRNGREKPALVLVAPIAVTCPLAPLTGPVVLECLTTPVFNVGDGLDLNISLRREGREVVLYSRRYDPGRIAADRSWIPISMAFSLGTGGDEVLKIEVSGGPQGDLVADWLALATPILVRRQGP